MQKELLICDGCENAFEELTKVNLITGRRGRPPIKWYCAECLRSESGFKVASDATGSPESASKIIVGFDPACIFLLSGTAQNLFEPANARDEITMRCKGCKEIIKRWEQNEHFDRHLKQLVVAA